MDAKRIDEIFENVGMATVVRVATFNVSLHRETEGALIADLEKGEGIQFRRIAEVIQRVRPSVILLNEVDYDADGRSLKLLQESFLAVSQNDQKPIEYKFSYTGPVNTGVDSGMDLDFNGKSGEPEDAFGFGKFPGQYGMVVLSKYPIDTENIRSFQNFLWKDMPNARLPIHPETKKPWYSDEIMKGFRLSSKSLWDVPIVINGNETVHLICSHPTPPVFDGEEDRNGCRNQDEIRMLADYVSDAEYLYDDNGVKGGLAEGSRFVIVGDLNADPVDGDNQGSAARLLTEHPLINNSKVPFSFGAKEAAAKSGGNNEQQKGLAEHDTGDFDDSQVGNMRIDYCLPSANFGIANSGVFWPSEDESTFHLNKASDHHLVWVEVQLY